MQESSISSWVSSVSLGQVELAKRKNAFIKQARLFQVNSVSRCWDNFERCVREQLAHPAGNRAELGVPLACQQQHRQFEHGQPLGQRGLASDAHPTQTTG